MSELRLVPPAVASWLMVLAVLVTRGVWCSMAIGVAVCVLLWGLNRWGSARGLLRGQAWLSWVIGSSATIAALIRVRVHSDAVVPEEIMGTVVREAKPTDAGFIMHLDVPGIYGQLPVFVRLSNTASLPQGSYGEQVRIAGQVVETQSPTVSPWLFVAQDIQVVGPPEGFRAWVAHVRDSFEQSVQAVMGEKLSGDGAGLMPAMILGDTSMQSAEAQHAYIATGLAHLSAVSGGNVAILTSAVVVVLALIGMRPVAQAMGAMVALAIFVTVVGLEPSVLRAMITGMVGLIAVLCSTRTPPMHSLSVAVVLGLLWDSSLATNFGFALSVGATAGIIALSPLVFNALIPLNMPEVVARAIAVTISAELLTMPLVAAMAGHVSTVSVVANVLAAVVVVPVTILGMVAVIFSLLPFGLEIPLLYLCFPLVEWIALVARLGAATPGATVSVPEGWLGVAWVSLCCAWVVGLALIKRMKIAMCALGAVVLTPSAWGVLSTVTNPHRLVDQSTLITYEVDTIDAIDQAPAGTQLIIVTDPEGTPSTRPNQTASGIPILFPHRDGEVFIYSNGVQKAANGRF